MKKHKVSKAKPKKLNFKMLLAGLALFLSVGGYVLYRNSLEIPSINLADGLEADEAAFLSKTIKKSTPAAPAPLIKVTTKNTAGQEVTKRVSVEKLQKVAEIKDEATKKIAIEAINKDIVETGIANNEKNQVVKNETAVAIQPPAGNQLGAAPAVIGTGTCSTNGSPVTVGTWVATGRYGADDKSNSEPGQERCTQCVNAGGKTYDKTDFCNNVVARGELVVLPVHQQVQKINGVEIKMASCYADVGGGSYVLVAPGQETSHKGKKGFCSPSGEIVDTLAKNKSFGDLCAARGLVEKNGKCEQKTADKPADPTKDAIAASIIACEKAGKYHISGTTKCGVDKPKDQNKSNGEPNITLITCMVGGQKKVYPAGTDCSKIAGSVESIALLNTVNKNSKNLGGEIVSTPAECRYGGAPLVNDRNLSTQTICFDYLKKLPSNTSTPVKSNPAAGTIFSNPKDSNELTARRDCEAAKTAGYECKSVGFNKYQLVLIPTITSPLNSNAKPLSLQNGSGKTSGQVNDPNDCKYTPVATDPVSDKWVCPTEQTVAQFTPKSNERPEGQKSYVAPGNKLYNGGSCYDDNGACLSGYCEVKFGFNKCANPTQSGPEYNQEVVRKVDEMYAQVKASGKCTNTNIDTGIRINCDIATNEPIISYCDQGNGNFDENGVCNPSSQDISIIREAAKIQRAEENTINGAVGLTAICSLAIGAGLVFAPASLGGSLAIPVAICGTAGVAGGVMGYFGAK